MGVELDQEEIVASLRAGLDVVQGDLNKGLSAFADGQFDVVVLSQTLQTVTAVERRGGRHASGWQAGHRQLPPTWRIARCARCWPTGAFPARGCLARIQLVQHAHMWRFLSIADFEDFCLRTIHPHSQADCIKHGRAAGSVDDPNLNADVAVVVISR